MRHVLQTSVNLKTAARSDGLGSFVSFVYGIRARQRAPEFVMVVWVRGAGKRIGKVDIGASIDRSLDDWHEYSAPYFNGQRGWPFHRWDSF